MESVKYQVYSILRYLIVSVWLMTIVGCGAPEARFHVNRVYYRKINDVTKQQDVRDLADSLASLFGTPDEPHLPAIAENAIDTIINSRLLSMSAGRVLSSKDGQAQGLFREHCVHCHGVTGDGLGPTAAFLNPYPRDYRLGVFKFKSTPKGVKPTHGDLKQIVLEGIPGTAMPSFKVLANDEIESLVYYVKYLAIRGETERRLIDEIVELDDERLIDISLKEKAKDKFNVQIERLKSVASDVIQKWTDAESAATEISTRTAGWDDKTVLAASEKRGRELFYGPIANCVKCHGDSALGDGQTADFDDWTKDIGLPDRKLLGDYRELGALAPRTIRPRNLRLGVFRGGRKPIDIYWRVHNGIDGTPMPAALLKPSDAPPETKGLTQEDIWALVDYVRSLPYEQISNPDAHVPSYARERL